MTQLPFWPIPAPGEAVETGDGRLGTVDRVGFLAPEADYCKNKHHSAAALGD